MLTDICCASRAFACSSLQRSERHNRCPFRWNPSALVIDNIWTTAFPVPMPSAHQSVSALLFFVSHNVYANRSIHLFVILRPRDRSQSVPVTSTFARRSVGQSSASTSFREHCRLVWDFLVVNVLFRKGRPGYYFPVCLSFCFSYCVLTCKLLRTAVFFICFTRYFIKLSLVVCIHFLISINISSMLWLTGLGISELLP